MQCLEKMSQLWRLKRDLYYYTKKNCASSVQKKKTLRKPLSILCKPWSVLCKPFSVSGKPCIAFRKKRARTVWNISSDFIRNLSQNVSNDKFWERFQIKEYIRISVKINVRQKFWVSFVDIKNWLLLQNHWTNFNQTYKMH